LRRKNAAQRRPRNWSPNNAMPALKNKRHEAFVKRTRIDRIAAMTLDSHIMGIASTPKRPDFYERFMKRLQSPTYAKDNAVGVKNHIYVVRAGQTNFFKIGIAVNVTYRLFQLQNGNHEELTVFKSWPSGERWETRFAERNIHRFLAHCRVRGEWFELNETQQRFIAEAPELFPFNKHNPLRDFTEEEFTEFLDHGERGDFFEWADFQWP
jgi:Meiotically up-regulated gene 113